MLIMLIILILLSLFISFAVIFFSLGVAAMKNSKLIDEEIRQEIKWQPHNL
jgi:hypothetical protein